MIGGIAKRALAALLIGSLVACADLGTSAGRAINEHRIDSALADNKAVIIATYVPFDYTPPDALPASLNPGTYRPPVTQWQNRDTKKIITIGGTASSDFYVVAKARALNSSYIYSVVEPGTYDLIGFARKVNSIPNLYELPVSTTAVTSPFGVIRYSVTTLPSLRSYNVWVPPRYAGEGFDGQTLTTYYTAGHSEQATEVVRKKAVYVDGTGLLGHTADGRPTMASFTVKPGQVLVMGDFAINYETGSCNQIPGVWECAVQSLSFSVDTAASRPDVQEALETAGFDQALVAKVEDAKMVPGAFFADRRDARPDSEKRHNLHAKTPTYTVITAHPPTLEKSSPGGRKPI